MWSSSTTALLGWFVYLVGSLAYLAVDGLSALNIPMPAVVVNSLYAGLAILFLFNALTYLLLWKQELDPEAPFVPDVALWGELLNVFASILYVVSAVFYFFFPTDSGVLGSAHVTVQAALNFAAVLLYLLDALLYASAYWTRRVLMRQKQEEEEGEEEEEPLMRDTEFWGEGVNVGASAGYAATGGVQLFAMLGQQGGGGGEGYDALLRSMRAINLLFDALYLLDAILYARLWYLDAVKQHLHQQVIIDNNNNKSVNNDDDDFRDMRRMVYGDSRPLLLAPRPKNPKSSLRKIG